MRPFVPLATEIEGTDLLSFVANHPIWSAPHQRPLKLTQDNDNPCFLHSKMYDWHLSSPPFFCTATPMADASVALPIQECQYSVFLHSNPSDWNHNSPTVFVQQHVRPMPQQLSPSKNGRSRLCCPMKGGQAGEQIQDMVTWPCNLLLLQLVLCTNYACLISYKHMKIIVKKHSNKNSKSKRASSL